MIRKKTSLLVLSLLLAISSFSQQLSYNTTLLGRWSNDSLPYMGDPFGQRFNELWGYFDSVKAREYIIMGSIDSIYFFDVTDPAHISLRDVEAGRSPNCVNRDFQTYKHYAYAVNDQNHGSLQVFDLQYLPDSVHKVYDSDTLGKTTHTICVYKDKLYMCSNTSNQSQVHAMRIASLAQPDSPTFVTTFDAPIVGGSKLFANIHDMIIVDDTAYLSCGNDGLFIYDFTDPFSPKYVYSLNQYQQKGYNHNSWLSADKKHIIFTDENLGLAVKLFEIASPTSYRLKSLFISHTGAMAHNPFIIGNNKAYLSYYEDGVYMYDISDPSDPKPFAYYDTYPENNSIGYTGFKGCWGVYPFLPSGNIFAADMNHGLFALRMGVTGISSTLQQETLGLYPNPTQNSTRMKLFSPSNENAQVQITDCKGEKVMILDISLEQGKNDINVETAGLSAGIYFIQVTSSHAVYTARLVKQ